MFLERWGRHLSRAAGLAILVWTLRRLGLSATAALTAFVVLGLALLPPGVLLCRMLPDRLLRRGERTVLAVLLGYPAFAALYWLSAVADVRHLYPAFMLGLAGLAVAVHWRDRRLPVEEESPETTRHSARAHWSLFVLVPFALLVATRGAPPFVAGAGGALLYDHSMDHSIHMAFYWELLRDTPPEQIPALAGVPFPRYHLLAFMPGLLLADFAGLQISTVYHLVSPLLRFTLLMAAVYLVVRVRTGDGRLATAAIPAMLFLSDLLAVCLDGRFLENTTPLYFFIRSESGGGGLVVWAIVGVLTALYDRAQALSDPRTGRVLDLAAILAGLSFFFKAQIFAVLGVSFALVLAARALRARSLRYLRALVLMGLALLVLLVSWRASGELGRLYWTPGALVEQYVYPVLAADPSPIVRETVLGFFRSFPVGSGWIVATPLTLWRMVAFSPLVLLFVLRSLRRFNTIGVTDGCFALAFPIALVWAGFVSAREITGEITPYEVLQATHGLALIGAVANVVVLAALLSRFGLDAARVVLWAVLLSSVVAVWAILDRPPFVPARIGIVLRPDEQCGLAFLREKTPFDAVVASDRSDSLPELWGTVKRFNHQAVISGLGGRRSVLEYYSKQTDREQNRQRTLRRLFSTGDAEEARQILETFGIDYVFEYSGHPLQFDTAELDLVFTRGGIRIYARREAARRHSALRPRAAAPWFGFLQERSDLSCRE